MTNPVHGEFAEALKRGEPASIPLGDSVYCDDCSGDFTSSSQGGGILFQSKAIGPCCAARWEAGARKYGEEQFIRARCPEGVSFGDWVRGIRGPDAAITITPGLPRRPL